MLCHYSIPFDCLSLTFSSLPRPHPPFSFSSFSLFFFIFSLLPHFLPSSNVLPSAMASLTTDRAEESSCADTPILRTPPSLVVVLGGRGPEGVPYEVSVTRNSRGGFDVSAKLLGDTGEMQRSSYIHLLPPEFVTSYMTLIPCLFLPTVNSSIYPTPSASHPTLPHLPHLPHPRGCEVHQQHGGPVLEEGVLPGLCVGSECISQ